MRHILFVAIAGLGLLVPASLASACINDRESEKSEKEFKSRYLEQQPSATPESAPPPSNLVLETGNVVGIGLLVGACALCLVHSRREN